MRGDLEGLEQKLVFEGHNPTCEKQAEQSSNVLQLWRTYGVKLLRRRTVQIDNSRKHRLDQRNSGTKGHISILCKQQNQVLHKWQVTDLINNFNVPETSNYRANRGRK